MKKAIHFKHPSSITGTLLSPTNVCSYTLAYELTKKTYNNAFTRSHVKLVRHCANVCLCVYARQLSWSCFKVIY